MITITTQPNAHNSVFRPILFELSSNAVANDVQVRCKLFVSSNEVATIWASKIDGVFTFDLSSILHTFIEENVLNGVTQTFDLGGNAIPFYCEFSEFYDNSIGISSEYDSVTSNTYKANSINLDNYSDNFDDYILTGTESKFLTNAPNGLKINATDKPQLFFISDVSEVVVNVETSLNNSNNNYIYPQTLSNGYGGFLLEVDNPNVDFIDVWVEDTNEERLSEVRRFKLLNKESYRIEWLNVFNAVDGFNFTGKDSLSVETAQSTIKHHNALSFDASHHTESNYLTVSSNRVQVFSEFVNKATAIWLSEIQKAKKVWLVDDGIRKAIKVTSTSTPAKNGTDLIQVALSFEFMNFENY